jgi:hypothetical protein
MKLNGSLLVVAGLMLGSLGAVGCKSADKSADPGSSAEAATAVAPEETPDTAPTDNVAAGGVEKDERAFHYYAPHAPPALRVENRGVGPAGHFWSPGYYRWNGREHVWNNGAWYPERAGYIYNAPRWAPAGNRWEYFRGRWARR